VFPDLDKYKGTPLEYGRMESTASDPSVQQQYGMIVGIPNAGQVNAIATLNNGAVRRRRLHRDATNYFPVQNTDD